MHIEKMESRRLFAGTTVTFAAGVLTVSGGSKADTVNVVNTGSSAHVEVSDPSHNIFTSNDYTGVTAIKINGGGQNDTIFYTGDTIGAVIHGNGGNDSISVDDKGTGSSQVFGDAGSDSITLLQGNQTTVSGGSGNDTIFLNTDSGSATIDSATVVVDAGKGDDTIILYDGFATVQGGGGKDTLNVDTSNGAVAAPVAGVETVNTF